MDQQERERRRSEPQAASQQEANRLEQIDSIAEEPETLESQRQRRLEQMDDWEEEVHSQEPSSALESNRRRRQIDKMIEAEEGGAEPGSVDRETGSSAPQR